MAVKEFMETGERNVYVPIQKRKDEKERLIVIPAEVNKEYLTSQFLNVANTKQFSRNVLGVNTHSLIRFSR